MKRAGFTRRDIRTPIKSAMILLPEYALVLNYRTCHKQVHSFSLRVNHAAKVYGVCSMRMKIMIASATRARKTIDRNYRLR